MRIKVAYDISRPAERFGRSPTKDGIDRVYEGLLQALVQRSDVRMTVVDLCSSDEPVARSLRAYSFFLAHQDKAKFSFAPSVTDNGELDNFVFDALRNSEPEDLRGLMKQTLKWRLRGFNLYRRYPRFASGNFDVFHSPYMPLPSREVTKDIARVITVYDLIPIRNPEFADSHGVEHAQRIIDSIVVDRDWVTCISQHTKDEFCEYTGMSPARVFVAPLAAAPHFHPIHQLDVAAAVRQRYQIPEGDYLLSVAAPQPRKNLSRLIRCFFRLLDEQPHLPANLVLAGATSQGWSYDEVFAAAASSPKHSDRVIFTGHVADEDLAALYSAATGFVYPSLYEGFGLPALEAMACGTPVLTSNTTALPEVVGAAGLMVDPTDEDGLCDAMLKVLGNEQLRQQLARNSLARAAHFSWARCAEDTVKAYRTAAAHNLQ